jgi:hypothetical protein
VLWRQPVCGGAWAVIIENLVQQRYGGARYEFVSLDHGVTPELLQDIAEPLAHRHGDVVVHGVHSRHRVAAPVHLADLVKVSRITDRERFTNCAEYLKVTSGEMGAIVLVGASLLLPRLHQTVT